MPPAFNPATILHLSDLHFGEHCRFAGLSPDALRALAKRMATSVNNARTAQGIDAPVSLVIATGDIAESGQKAQYTVALGFFSALCEALELTPDRVLFVPGNHDISWPRCRIVENQQEDEEFDDAELARRMYEHKLTHYRRFQRDFYQCDPGQLGGADALDAGHTHAFVHSYDDLGISVATLDSCERETHNVHGGQLGEVQAQALMDYWRQDGRGYLRVVAIHHNPVADAQQNIDAWAQWLKQAEPGKDWAELIGHFVADTHGFDGRERLERVANDCDVSLILHGHVHTAGLASWSYGRGDLFQTHTIAAGSWGLDAHKRPENEPMSVVLLHVGQSECHGDPVLRQVRLRYEPRARQLGSVEAGEFVVDSGDRATATERLSLPSGHAGFRQPGAAADSDAAQPRDRGLDPRGDSRERQFDGAIDAFLAGYRAWNQTARDEWDVGGLGAATEEGEARDFRPKLRDMYVPLRFRPADLYGYGLDASDPDSTDIIGPDKVLSSDVPMILRGTAGQGKTTWMKWTFCRLLEDHDVMAFLIELRDLTQIWAESSAKERSIEYYLAARNSRFARPGDDVQAIITALLGRAHGPRPVLLIDGWDEVGEFGDRVRQDLKGLLSQYPRIRAVVTSRPHEPSKPSSHGDGFAAWDIEPLSAEDIELLAHKYFAAVYHYDEDSAERAQAKFLSALDGAASADDLAQTPLLLTMMLLISRSRTLPDKRHELYAACVETLLVDRPKVREVQGARTGHRYWAPEGKRERLKLLARIARWFSEHVRQEAWRDRLLVIERDDVIGYCRKQLQLGSDESKQFIAWLVDIAGLLVERDGGQTVSFVHLSFQEYLCAWDLHRDVAHDGAEDRLGSFRDRMKQLESWETLRLWAAIIHGDNEEKLTPMLHAFTSGSAAADIEDPIQRYELTAVGFWLAGAIFADGHGTQHDFGSWVSGLASAFTGFGYSYMVACANALRSSGQQNRRRDLASAWAKIATSQTWFGWQLAEYWRDTAGIEVTMTMPTGLAETVIGLVQSNGDITTMRPQTAAHAVALSRVLAGVTPHWPVAPVELAWLRIWPSRRSVVGMRLQSGISFAGDSREFIRPILNMPGDLARDLARYLAPDLVRYLAPDLARYLARYLAPDFARYVAPDLARYLDPAFYSDLARYLAPDLARYLDPAFARYFARDLAPDFARYVAPDFARYLAPDFDPDFAPDFDRGFARDFAPDFARDLAPDFAHSWALTFACFELFLSFGRASTRAMLAHSSDRDNPLHTLLKAACRISLAGQPDRDALAQPLGQLPPDTHPIWPALARWIARCADDDDQRVLEHYAANPDDCDAPLSWGMKYIVRGDVVLEDLSEATLDDLCDEAGIDRLPLLEPMLDELNLKLRRKT